MGRGLKCPTLKRSDAHTQNLKHFENIRAMTRGGVMNDKTSSRDDQIILKTVVINDLPEENIFPLETDSNATKAVINTPPPEIAEAPPTLMSEGENPLKEESRILKNKF